MSVQLHVLPGGTYLPAGTACPWSRRAAHSGARAPPYGVLLLLVEENQGRSSGKRSNIRFTFDTARS